MELRLVVLAGAKQGTRIPLKKDKFIIGRAKECTLRAGSEAISRRHCAIVRRDSGWVVKDLGSRNGTYVNDEKISAETPLKAGDQLRVGPLKFRVEAASEAASAEAQKKHEGRQPPVKDVADAAQRSADQGTQDTTEDDISRWLLGIADPGTDESMSDTRTISMQETATLGQAKAAQTDSQASTESETDKPASTPSQAEKTDEAATEKGGWNWLKLGKGKKKPGKLPTRPNSEPTKDSREAAADILREMTRRR